MLAVIEAGQFLVCVGAQTYGFLYQYHQNESDGAGVNHGNQHCLDLWGEEPRGMHVQAEFRHTFSHYHLDITPVVADLDIAPQAVMDASRQLWYNVRQPPQIGLAAPVAALLKELAV